MRYCLFLGLVLHAFPAIAAESPPIPFDRSWLEPHLRGPLLRAADERRRAGDWPGVVAALTPALPRVPRASPERTPARFLLAFAQAQTGRWAEAGAGFEALYRDDALLSAYHAYHAARCRLRRGDPRGALEWSARVPDGAVPAAEARIIQIEALRALERHEEVVAEASGFGARFPNGPRLLEVRFRHAEALEALGRAAEAAPIYRQVWGEARDGWSDRAEARLLALAPHTPAAVKTASDFTARGLVLFEQNRNEAAEAALTAALALPIDPATACTAQYHRAQTVWKLRQRARSLPLFAEAERACRAADSADLAAKATYQRARCLASGGEREASIAAFAEVEARHAEHSYADDARLRAALQAVEAGDEARAAELLRTLPERYPDGDSVGEALWRLAFTAYQAGDWPAARRWLDENIRRVPRATVWYAEGRAEYWQGRSFEREQDLAAAVEWWERAVRAYPLSLYAWLALEGLKRVAPARRVALVAELRAGLRAGPARLELPPRRFYRAPGFQRAVKLARLGQVADAHRELAAFAGELGNDGEREELLWITAAILDRGGLWSAAHSIPRHRVTEFRWRYPTDPAALARWRLAYPRAYGELVAAASAENHVPEALQLALMREESAFDPRAVSTASVVGLTMVKAETAADLNRGRPVPREKLFDPTINVPLGSRQLALLIQAGPRRSVVVAIAAYNAGIGAAGRWARERGHLTVDEWIETIPFDETRGYTKRVLASYFVYSWLYFPERAVPPLPW